MTNHSSQPANLSGHCFFSKDNLAQLHSSNHLCRKHYDHYDAWSLDSFCFFTALTPKQTPISLTLPLIQVILPKSPNHFSETMVQMFCNLSASHGVLNTALFDCRRVADDLQHFYINNESLGLIHGLQVLSVLSFYSLYA